MLVDALRPSPAGLGPVPQFLIATFCAFYALGLVACVAGLSGRGWYWSLVIVAAKFLVLAYPPLLAAALLAGQRRRGSPTGWRKAAAGVAGGLLFLGIAHAFELDHAAHQTRAQTFVVDDGFALHG